MLHGNRQQCRGRRGGGSSQGLPVKAGSSAGLCGWMLLYRRAALSLLEEAWGSGALGGSSPGAFMTAVPCPLWPQRAIRVRSHSMETMVGSQRKQHGGGIPGSLSGGIAHNSGEVTKTTFSVSAAPWPSVLLSVCESAPSHPGGVLWGFVRQGCALLELVLHGSFSPRSRQPQPRTSRGVPSSAAQGCSHACTRGWRARWTAERDGKHGIPGAECAGSLAVWLWCQNPPVLHQGCFCHIQGWGVLGAFPLT